MLETGRGAAASDDAALLRQFIRIDLVGATLGLTSVLVVNGAAVQNSGVWWTVPFLAILIGCLLLALRFVDRGRTIPALWAIAIGNWQIAIAVALILPFLWPVMVLAVVMPVVLAAPYLSPEALVPWVAGLAIAGGVVAILGLTSDDGGALPDIEDEAELAVVVAGLAAFLVPITLIVWQHTRRERERRLALTASQRRVVAASDAERSRIERDLHDGAQQRFVAVGLQLQLLSAHAEDDAELQEKIARVHDDLTVAIGELRELAHGIYPPVLEANGFEAAVAEIARRSPSPIRLDIDAGRFDRAVETTLYFVASEALANAAKHAPSAPVVVTLRVVGEQVVLTVTDEGPGLDPAARPGRGMLNMQDRLRAAGGTLTVTAGDPTGTVLTARVVLVPPSAGASTTAD